MQALHPVEQFRCVRTLVKRGYYESAIGVRIKCTCNVDIDGTVEVLDSHKIRHIDMYTF